jgi:hypothetical protein
MGLNMESGFLRIRRCSVDDVVGDGRRKADFDVMHIPYIFDHQTALSDCTTDVTLDARSLHQPLRLLLLEFRSEEGEHAAIFSARW